MSLRIPPKADQTTQVEFHEIERRLRKLEKALKVSGTSTVVRVSGGSSLSSEVNLTPVVERIEVLETAIAEIETTDLTTYGLVGSSASSGIVPTPGTSSPPTGIAQHVLADGNYWSFPLRGLVSVATSGDQTDPPNDVLTVQAAIHAVSLSAGVLEVNDLIVYGSIDGGTP